MQMSIGLINGGFSEFFCELVELAIGSFQTRKLRCIYKSRASLCKFIAIYVNALTISVAYIMPFASNLQNCIFHI